jgi:hypothetical protein
MIDVLDNIAGEIADEIRVMTARLQEKGYPHGKIETSAIRCGSASA